MDQYQVLTGDDLPPNVRQKHIQKEGMLIAAEIGVSSLKPFSCQFAFSVPRRSPLRTRSPAGSPDAISERLSSGISAAVADAVEILVVESAELVQHPPLMESESSPILQLRVELYGFENGQAEVQLALCDPEAIAARITRSSSRRRAMATTVAAIDKSLRDALRTEVSSGNLLSER